MAREKIGTFEASQETFDRLASPGALLVSGTDKPNVMTIGWGTMGIIWGKPIFTVLVRPSRHTTEFLDKHQEFTVCVPTPEMKKEVLLCGTKSGRELDKIVECGFTMKPGLDVEVPHIEQCPVHYECKTVHINDVHKTFLDAEIKESYYPAEDYHFIYYGEILGVYRKS